MTVETLTTTSGPYTGTGATDQEFPVTFQSASESELAVYLDGAEVDSSLWSFDRETDGTGTVTATLDGEVLIVSAPSFQQMVEFQRQGPYFPDDLNPPLDAAAIRDLWLKYRFDLLFPAAALFAAERAGMFLSWGGGGAPVLASGTGADGALRTDLAASGGAALVGILQSGAALARSVQDKLRRDLPFTPFDFAAVGDKTTDDTVALAAMATYLNSLCDNVSDGTLVGNYPRLEFPRCAGFKTTAKLTLNASIDVEMQSPLWVSSAAGTPINGLHYKDFGGSLSLASRDRTSIFDVRRLTLSNWGSALDVGVLIDAAYNGRIRIKRTDGFRTGFDACMGYGELRLGDHRQNKVSYLRARGSPAQFTNHLSVIGGAFANDSANAGADRYGLWIEGVAPYGANTILLDRQSYELAKSGAGAADAIPLVIDGTTAAVNNVRAINQRSETNGNPFVRILGAVRNVEIGILDGELEYTYPTSQMVDDQSTGGGSIHCYRHHGATSPAWKEIFNSGRLVDRAVKLTGPIVTIQNLETATDAGAAPATQTFAYGVAGPTFDASGFMTAAGPFVGARVRLNGDRSIGVVGTKPSGAAADVRIICFDAAGVQIVSAGAVRLEQSDAVYTAGAYGGYYTVGLNPANAATAFEGVLAFISTVATAFIAVSTPVGQFSLRSQTGRAQWFSATSHLRDQFVGEAIPIAFTNVAYKQGSKVLDPTPAAAGTEGWILTDQPASGAAGTWKTFGVIAA